MSNVWLLLDLKPRQSMSAIMQSRAVPTPLLTPLSGMHYYHCAAVLAGINKFVLFWLRDFFVYLDIQCIRRRSMKPEGRIEEGRGSNEDL